MSSHKYVPSSHLELRLAFQGVGVLEADTCVPPSSDHGTIGMTQKPKDTIAMVPVHRHDNAPGAL